MAVVVGMAIATGTEVRIEEKAVVARIGAFGTKVEIEEMFCSCWHGYCNCN